jgi:hypothetical protein
MKGSRVVSLAIVCLAVMTTVLCAADVSVGTWKVNLAKSKYNPANLAPKSSITKIVAVADGITNVTDVVDADGKAIHYEFTAKYDGKDYPVKGDPNRDTVSAKKIDDYTFDFTSKKGGKVTTTTHIVYARDGKSRTLTTTGTNAQGVKVTNTVVADKQ